MKRKLDSKWALVTGSSRGIGQQIAVGLARYGANIIVHGRHLRHAKETVALLDPLDVDVEVVAGDFGTPEGVQAVIDAVERQVGGIDILYNNAAISHPPTPILKISHDFWERVFQVNVWALIELCQAFAPGMQARRWGRIVNLTSGIADRPELAAYSASKATVDKFSRDLAAALKDHNVLVNYLGPGWLKTDLGGPNAQFPVETILPGALVPALLDNNGPTGRLYSAQDYKMLG